MKPQHRDRLQGPVAEMSLTVSFFIFCLLGKRKSVFLIRLTTVHVFSPDISEYLWKSKLIIDEIRAEQLKRLW